MSKETFEEHMAELAKNTSGGAHDAVTFSGKGLGLLSKLFKSAKGKGDFSEEEEENGEKSDDDTEEGEDGKKVEKNATGTEKNEKSNGGPLTEEEEDPDSPDHGKQGTIITNHGKKVTPKGAVSKNEGIEDEEPLFKNFNEEYGDVLEASEVLGALAKNVELMSISTTAGVARLQNTVMVLAKGLESSLKAQAALAADLELIKSQPAARPSTGFVVMEKRESSGGARTLSKSDVQDIVTEALNKGEVEPMDLARLGTVRSNAELNAYVASLPEAVQARL